MGSRAGTDLVARVGGIRSRLGRRLLVLFIACALVPVAILAFWSHRQVRAALLERGQGRLEVAAKELAVAMVDRGQGLSDLLRVAGATPDGLDPIDAERRLARWTTPAGEGLALMPEQVRHLGQGRPLLVFDARHAASVRLLHSASGGALWSWGEIPLDRLLGFSADDETDPPLCVASSQDGRVLQCSAGADPAVVDANGRGRRAEWLVARRSVFLRFEFGAPDLEVIAMRRRAEVVAAGDIGSLFILVAMLSLLVVFATGHRQIRRITTPLEQLTAAAAEVRQGQLTARVPEEGDDELAGLARSFNAMSASIARQMADMEALDEVDRVALESGGRTRVAHVALERVRSEGGIADAMVLILSEGSTDAWTCVREGMEARRLTLPGVHCPVQVGRALSAGDCGLSLDKLGCAGAPAGWEVIPLRHAGRIEGMLLVHGGAAERAWFLHQVADRLAMALANRHLVEDLDAFSLGTLTAFARAVDANSSWTAGHSERVTTAAVALGTRAHLTPHDLERLRRGGLLHDIGKIGVPTTILDKPGRLEPEEMRIMQLHPVIGYDILSPIPAMRDVLPIVRHHHERMDGGGYPDGLSGQQIPLVARVLAVADVYDALVSDRPYRKGLSTSEACTVLRSMAGPHLDGALVRMFLAMLDEQGQSGDGDGAPLAWAPADAAGVT